MAFYCHTLEGTNESPDRQRGELGGPDIELGGVTYKQKTRDKLSYVYAGEPSEELLRHEKLKVMTARFDPWPGSQMDNWTRRAPENCRPRGDGLPRVGPGYMLHMQQLGKWPDAKTRETDALLEARIKDPGAVARALFKRQGATDGQALEAQVARAERIVNEGDRGHALPNPADLLEEGQLKATGTDGPQAPPRRPPPKKATD